MGVDSVYIKRVKGTDPMQLTAKTGNMVVDFYPVKFATGEIHNRLMLKVVTFMGKTQSKSLTCTVVMRNTRKNKQYMND